MYDCIHTRRAYREEGVVGVAIVGLRGFVGVPARGVAERGELGDWCGAWKFSFAARDGTKDKTPNPDMDDAIEAKLTTTTFLVYL